MTRNPNSYLLTLVVSILLFFWRSPLTLAAEKISFRYGYLEFEIPVDSLENAVSFRTTKLYFFGHL